MAARKRTREENLELRAQIMNLKRRGYSQTQIAAMLKMTQQMVSYHVQSIEKEWLASAQADTAFQKAMVLAKLNGIEQAAWEGWDYSMESTVPSRTPRNSAAGSYDKSKRQSASLKDTGQNTPGGDVKSRAAQGRGNPKFLDVLLQCAKQQSSVMGLDSAPVPVAEAPKAEPLSANELATTISEIFDCPAQEESAS